MNTNKTDLTQLDETIRTIEEGERNAREVLFEDIEDLQIAMGRGRDTKSHYEYVRDFLTYLINKNDYWE
tara:strand:+ start:2077 stop:2283 length:207 start_codon:yes stop_codon:yes gene_type:complete